LFQIIFVELREFSHSSFRNSVLLLFKSPTDC